MAGSAACGESAAFRGAGVGHARVARPARPGGTRR